ncbi:c-type cytochrome [Acidovorax sp.]|uniref:c-type cytochrome n=1 Tax=Acidovorax sp. TaxID=1872122 RepID=UPI002ACDFE89|nr:c-type cytochrome [Acidovorax sp.]MDZ7865972.1 c-type cytochrome [Acidovorax sp.]
MFRSISQISGIAVVLILANPAAQASDALATKSNCMACHSKNTKIVGPAFKDIAAKYAGEKGATDKLVQKVKKGGGGVWGPMPMPPNAGLSDADARALVVWILQIK